MAASKSLRNDFAEQMFTLQLSNILPRAILNNNFAFLLSRKDALLTRLATKIMSSSYYLFSSYSFATGMANMSPNIFISNVLLKKPTERNA